MEAHECVQADNIQKIADTLHTCAEKLARIDERLISKIEKYDEHIKNGMAYRVGLIGTVVAFGLACTTALVAYGEMKQKIEFTYQHSYGVHDAMAARDRGEK